MVRKNKKLGKIICETEMKGKFKRNGEETVRNGGEIT